jgi:hypothetical protein
MRYTGATRYVIRDFSTATDAGVAHVHVVENSPYFHSCKRLEKYSVHDEAWERGGCNGVDLTAAEFEYTAATVEEAEAAHRRQFTMDFSIHRHECVNRHQQWLAGLVTLPELAAELRLDTDDMDDLWHRTVDAAYRPSRMFTSHQRVGHQLIAPETTDVIRAHVADHPNEYRRLPAPAGR